MHAAFDNARRTWPSLALLCVCCVMPVSGMEHGRSGKVPAAADPCADVSQPASLRCALTPSAVFAPGPDTGGRLWLVWAHGGHVYIHYSDDQGKTFSDPQVVNAVPERIAARGENRPKIALGPQGQVYVSWTQPLTKRFTGHIRFARSVDGGKTFSEPVVVNEDHAEISHRFEALSVDAAGNVFLAWIDKRDQAQAQARGKPYLGAALYYTWSEDQGLTFKPNRKLLDNSCECCRVMTALDTQGQPVVLWRHVFGDNIRDHALVAFTAPGKPTDITRVSVDDWKIDACPHHGPALSIDHNNVYHLTWYTNGTQRSGLFYAQSKDQGKTFSAPVGFGGSDTNAGHAHVLARGGRVYIVWQDFDGTQSRVRMMMSEDSGNHWAPVQEIAQSKGETDYPFLIADADKVYVAWQTRAEGYRLIPVSVVAESKP